MTFIPKMEAETIVRYDRENREAAHYCDCDALLEQAIVKSLRVMRKHTLEEALSVVLKYSNREPVEEQIRDMIVNEEKK